MPWVRPKKEEVAKAHVYTGAYGFRYSLRDDDGKVIWEAPHPFRSRFDAIKEIKTQWGLTASDITTEVG